MMIRTCCGALALALLTIPGAQAQAPCARYDVRRVDADHFAVEARFAEPARRFDLFHFPLAERPEGQSESIRALTAYGADGRAAPIEYVGEGGWESPGAARIRYRVRADHDEVDWGVNAPGKDEVAARFDASYFFVGHAFFLADFSLECPIEVRFELPRGWRVTAPWPMQDNVAVAQGPWDLAQNLFVMGRDAPSRVTTRGGGEIEWLVDSRIASVAPQASALMGALPDAYAEFWGAAPIERLVTVFVADTMSDGGAFRSSFAMRVAAPVSDADTPIWTHTLGHEIMHLWLGAGAIQGADADELYWFTEGFTDYLTIKLMRRAGLTSEEMLAQRLANLVRRFEQAKRASPAVSLSEAGAQKGANWQWIYGGGAMIALLLDAELSAQDPEAFRAMLRDVYAHADAPYTQAALMARMDAQSGGKASELKAWVESRPAWSEVRARLARAGIDAAMFGYDEAYVSFADGAPAFLAGPRTTGRQGR